MIISYIKIVKSKSYKKFQFNFENISMKLFLRYDQQNIFILMMALLRQNSFRIFWIESLQFLIDLEISLNFFFRCFNIFYIDITM